MASPGIDIASQLDAEHRAAFEEMPPRDLDPTDIERSVAALREGAAERAAEAPPAPEGVSIEDRQVAGPDGAPKISIRLYRPANLPDNAPALYWIHGGGMVLGSVETSDDFCGRFASNLRALVASVEYRLAPEHPFPAPLDDCYAGLRWLASSTDELKLDPGRIAIGGGSAGGGLAAGLALLVRDLEEIEVCFQLLVYPMIDDRNVTPSSHAITDPRLWDRSANLVGWNAYLEGNAGAEGVSPYAAPARATNLAGLPPAYISVGALDLFLDEDIAYAQALLEANVPVELRVYPGAFHGSPNRLPDADLSRRWAADLESALERALHGA